MEHQTSTTSRWLIGTLSVLSVVLMLFLAVLTSFHWLGHCGGDGGSPYSARISPMGQVCADWYAPEGQAFLTIGGAIAFGVAVAAIASLRTRRLRILGMALLIGLLLHGGLWAVPMTLRDECTAEERQIHSSYDCVTY